MGLLTGQTDKTRIKICGLTRPADVDFVVSQGVDALGYVFYRPSPRFVTPELAASLISRMPGGIDVVALVVDPTDEEIQQIRDRITVDIWQFHGDEAPQRCIELAQGQKWMKAARIHKGFNLSDFCLQYRDATAWLLDAFVDGFGGGGKTFDWSLIPQEWIKENAHRVVLSGGLNSHNVGESISRFHPLAVDISSGVESAKGIKDPKLVSEFVQAVKLADQINH
jgi:phosphoribosylanthranilate isomerase